MATRKQAAQKQTMNTSLMAAAGVAALAGAAWYFRNELMGLLGYRRIHVAPHVQAKLPIAKDLPTIPDQEANYDIDGVSFDSEGVIVGSDKQFESPTEKQVHH